MAIYGRNITMEENLKVLENIILKKKYKDVNGMYKDKLKSDLLETQKEYRAL